MKTVFNKLNRFFYGKWHLAVLDIHAGRWVIEPKILNIPYLKAENANGRHILLQPEKTVESYYLLVDDLSWPTIQSHHLYSNGTWKPGRMAVETSPENYQVWIHSSRPLSLDEKRYWLRKLQNDPGADPNKRWGRCPGFRNRKEKYRDSKGGYPLAKLIGVDWKRQADIPYTNFVSSSIVSHFPPQPLVGGVCQSKSIARQNYECGNESDTDFSYALALMRRGFSDHDIRIRIISERNNWKNHPGQRRMNTYLDRTIKKARITLNNCCSKLN